MCIKFTYVCPICKAPSGHVQAEVCPPEDKCIQKLEFNRLMKAKHFDGWICSTPGCGYSRDVRQTECAEILAAIKAMREAQAALEEDSDEDGVCPAFPGAPKRKLPLLTDASPRGHGRGGA
jgi:hypothetical protein